MKSLQRSHEENSLLPPTWAWWMVTHNKNHYREAMQKTHNKLTAPHRPTNPQTTPLTTPYHRLNKPPELADPRQRSHKNKERNNENREAMRNKERWRGLSLIDNERWSFWRERRGELREKGMGQLFLNVLGKKGMLAIWSMIIVVQVKIGRASCRERV